METESLKSMANTLNSRRKKNELILRLHLFLDKSLSNINNNKKSHF